MKKQILFALVALLLALPSAQAAKKDAPLYFPPAKGQWEKIDPAKIGWNPAKLKELMDYAGKNKSSGIVILYRGRILAEQYWPLDPKEKTAEGKPNPYFHMRLGKDAKGRTIEDVASAQKSVTAMLVGIAQHKGLLKITDPVHKHLGKSWSKAPAAAEANSTGGSTCYPPSNWSLPVSGINPATPLIQNSSSTFALPVESRNVKKKKRGSKNCPFL